jgi:hypothetical protein
MSLSSLAVSVDFDMEMEVRTRKGKSLPEPWVVLWNSKNMTSG